MEHIFLMVFVRCPEKSHLFRKERTMQTSITETIDGKDTFHSMARAVLQVKSARLAVRL
jgi:hypothetical protein